jgi:hypothetical protein
MLLHRNIRAVICAVACVALFGATQAHAVEYGGIGGRPASPRPDNSRTDSIFVHTVTPGESATDAILLVNNSDTERTLEVYAVDSVPSSDGAFACAQQGDEKTGVGSWVTLASTEATLASGAQTTVPFTVAVPTDANVGESNGCIVVQEKKAETTTDNGGGVQLSFRTAIRLAVTVPGDIIRELRIQSLSHTKTTTADTINIALHNAGNVSLDTNMHTTVRTIFGKSVLDQEGEFPVLRDQTSQFHFDMPKTFWGGWYKAAVTVSYDGDESASLGISSGEEKTTLSSETAWFFIMPSTAGLSIEVGVLFAVVIAVLLIVIRIVHMQYIKKTWVSYTVKTGESLQRIAKDRRISWKVVASVNKLKAPYDVTPGQDLRVPPMQKNSPTGHSNVSEKSARAGTATKKKSNR